MSSFWRQKLEIHPFCTNIFHCLNVDFKPFLYHKGTYIPYYVGTVRILTLSKSKITSEHNAVLGNFHFINNDFGDIQDLKVIRTWNGKVGPREITGPILWYSLDSVSCFCLIQDARKDDVYTQISRLQAKAEEYIYTCIFYIMTLSNHELHTRMLCKSVIRVVILLFVNKSGAKIPLNLQPAEWVCLHILCGIRLGSLLRMRLQDVLTQTFTHCNNTNISEP
jgi:hypothetical protein